MHAPAFLRGWVMANGDQHHGLVKNGSGRVDPLRLTQLVVTILMGVALPFVGWLALTVVSHGRLLERTDGNRFTIHDGAALRAELDARLDRIELAIAQLPQEVPPPHVKAELARLAKMVEKLEQRWDDHERGPQHGR